MGDGLLLYRGDNLEVLPMLEANSMDTCVTDPPYGLGFMGKDWDRRVPGKRYWFNVFRVMKPGAMLLAFGGTRTWHRLACAIEDAGFEIMDTLLWLHGQGLPKSLDISKAIDKAAGAERTQEVWVDRYHDGGARQNLGYSNREGAVKITPGHNGNMASLPATSAAAEWDGWGTALKPAWEPIVVAMKPLDGSYARNALKWGVAGLNIEGARIPTGAERVEVNRWDGGAHPFGGGAGKPYTKAIENGGRWPANVILDSEAARLLDVQSGITSDRARVINHEVASGFISGGEGGCETVAYGDEGGASRFFQRCDWDEDDVRFCYCPKAGRKERDMGLDGVAARERDPFPVTSHGVENGVVTNERHNRPLRNFHPTVKPLALMRYLVRMTKTPTGGTVLDLFAGTGTTGMAAKLEGRGFVGIEIDADTCEIARLRMEAVAGAGSVRVIEVCGTEG